MANTHSQPSGLQLMELIEHNIQEILGKEESNVSEIRLYKTGRYWVAFEKSAYLLTSVSPDISLVPVAITRLSAPLVMANIEARTGLPAGRMFRKGISYMGCRRCPELPRLACSPSRPDCKRFVPTQPEIKIDNNKMKKKNFLLCTLFLLMAGTVFLSSCGTSKDVVYFQDMKPGESEIVLPAVQTITVQPEDKISIIVNSRDPQLTDLFNLPYVSRQIGQSQRTNGMATGSSNGVSGYTVDANGDIDFPVIGKIHVAGLCREEIAKYIKNELVTKNLVKDPVVTVEFMNLCISVLGEVNDPGRFAIDRDRVTILDALSMAGDLTIYGNRFKVMVLRQEGDVQRVYGIDLTSGDHVYTSPAYYLQQNDVVYVEPNNVKARQSTVNGNNVRSTSFWISLASLLTSIGILIFN